MKGLLITNAFLRSAKFTELYTFLENACLKEKVALSCVTNAEISAAVYTGSFLVSDYDFILFWDKDIVLAQALESMGARVFNSADSILRCDDKSLTFLRLREKGIPIPRTIPAPKTYSTVGYEDFKFLSEAAAILGFPMIVKECFGSFGQQVYLCGNQAELEALTREKAGTPLLFQQAITESFGRDVRVNIVGDRIAASILRESSNGDFRSNLTLGGSMSRYEPTSAEREAALAAARALKLDFCGVDVLFGKDGPLVCEVNSNAHFKTTLDATGINMAELIIRHIRERIGE